MTNGKQRGKEKDELKERCERGGRVRKWEKDDKKKLNKT
jgi:hypothetical protein